MIAEPPVVKARRRSGAGLAIGSITFLLPSVIPPVFAGTPASNGLEKFANVVAKVGWSGDSTFALLMVPLEPAPKPTVPPARSWSPLRVRASTCIPSIDVVTALPLTSILI